MRPPPTLDRERRLQRHVPDPEALLWRALRDGLPRARFRRRVPIGPYVAAFVSRSAGLIVEVDCGRDGGARDASRTRFLNRHGYRLIRFWDGDVLRDASAVLDAIACALPAALLEKSGPVCRLGGPGARAAWSPKPDCPLPEDIDQ